MSRLIWSTILFVCLANSAPLMAQEKNSQLNGTINETVLKQIIARSEKTESDAVVVWQDGKLIHESYFDEPRGPIESMSATKSVVALAFGLLLADKKLESLDEPVHKFYPEWNQGLKAKITIKDLLTQRSGLQCDRRTTAIYRAPDFVQFALAADLVDEPGKKWRYNNKGCNLLPGIVQKISGQRMDNLIGERIFKPLGITDWSWSLDKAGNPHGMSGLQIRPEDFVKIGQLMLDGGNWDGKQILPAGFVKSCVTDITPKPKDTTDIDFANATGKDLYPKLGYDPNGFRPNYGLLWWVDIRQDIAMTDRLLQHWKENGVDEKFLSKMAELKGLRGDAFSKKMGEVNEGDFFTHIVQKGLLDWDVLSWNYHGFSADGFLGQYLVVVPEHRIVAVRMRRTPIGEFDESKIDAFKDFKKLVSRLGESNKKE